MNKQQLNNAMIHCRPKVKMAKVFIIRHISKQMKLLKTCKGGKFAEKKKRKLDRLVQMLTVMKHLKSDTIMRFALPKNTDEIEATLRATPANSTEHGIATLANHPFVQKEIQNIRAEFPDWQKDLPQLLESIKIRLEKKCKTKDFKLKVEKIETNGQTDKQKHKDNKSKDLLSENKKLSVKDKIKLESAEDSETTTHKSKNVTIKMQEVENTIKTTQESKPVKKIVDCFFIDKEVIAPKLLQEEDNTRQVPTVLNETGRTFDEKHYYTKRVKPERPPLELKRHLTVSRSVRTNSPKILEPNHPSQMLHPSWAAKKVKLIQPFQGKKTTFS